MLAGGTDLMVEVNEAHRRLDRARRPSSPSAGSPSCARGSTTPIARTVRLGAGVTYAELGRRAAGDAAARRSPRRRAPSGRRRSATRRRSAATWRRARRPVTGCPCSPRSTPTSSCIGPDGRRTMPVGEFMVGVKRTALAAGRADRRGHRPAARRLAGLRQGRRAQRHGDRHRRRLPRRRPAGALGPPRPRLGGADDRAGAGGRGVRRGGRRLGRRHRRATTPSSASASSPPRPAGRSTTTGRPRPTAAAPSRCSPAGCCAGRSRRPTVAEHYTLHVNGGRHDVADAWLGESLLYVLRERLGLLGAKGACEQGECGSCSVLVDGELVCSCLVLAASAVDVPIVTVEGLAEPRRADRRAAGVRRRRRRAVRVLHAGAGDGRPRPARAHPAADASPRSARSCRATSAAAPATAG